MKVPWYQSVDELIAGLMKNVYAFFDYRLHYAFIGMSCLVAVVLLPYAGLIVADGFARVIFLLCILLRCIGIGSGMISSGIPASAALWLLLSPFISLYIIARAVASCLLAGGITWRGSFYPLAELKEQRGVGAVRILCLAFWQNGGDRQDRRRINHLLRWYKLTGAHLSYLKSG